MRGELYNYDPRGNILKVSDIASAGSDYLQYSYSGDCLTAISNNDRGVIDESFSFTHDNLGRMISDGLSGLQMEYNYMDLLTEVRRDSTILVKYSYLADGSKASSLKASGEGLVYRGPFTYRRLANGSLSLESVVCAEGRLTSGKALLYVTDHLGSVRAVIDGNTGSTLEASDYSAYGSRSDASYPGNTLPIGPGHDFIGDLAPSLPGGDLGIDWGVGSSITYRDHFTGQEDQLPDFGIPYSDHGARQYSPALRRWMTLDPLSEKYYGLSPYNYCGCNPLSFVDSDGRSLKVKRLEDGTFEILGGDLDDDLNIYEYTQDDSGSYTIKGESIGIMATPYSFYDSDSNEWKINVIINPNDNSGIDFLSNIGIQTGLLNYMSNATENKFYDFKNTNGELIPSSRNHYRGMPIEGINGQLVYASARDVGNIAAGMVASLYRIPWKAARIAFDSLESIQRKCISKEGLTTQSAQKYGYVMGYYKMISQLEAFSSTKEF